VDSARWAEQRAAARGQQPRLVDAYLRYEEEEGQHPWAMSVHPTALGDLMEAIERSQWG
jgi:hypothetical protein